MDTKFLIQALLKFLFGVILLASLIFFPAGTWHFWQGWVLIGVLFVPMFSIGVIMLAKHPELLRKRLNVKETEKEQKTVIAFSGVFFVAMFVVAGLNWRFSWSVLPDWLVWIAVVLFLICYLLYAEVLRENTFLSRTIEVQKNQKVVVGGLYAIVRHPMYTATTLMFLVMPLVLASSISFLIMLLYIPLIVKRIKNEESVLEEKLEGYKDYMMRVKFRLFPYIW